LERLIKYNKEISIVETYSTDYALILASFKPRKKGTKGVNAICQISHFGLNKKKTIKTTEKSANYIARSKGIGQ